MLRKNNVTSSVGSVVLNEMLQTNKN
jgi:hypothetical protein